MLPGFLNFNRFRQKFLTEIPRAGVPLSDVLECSKILSDVFSRVLPDDSSRDFRSISSIISTRIRTKAPPWTFKELSTGYSPGVHPGISSTVFHVIAPRIPHEIFPGVPPTISLRN